MRKVKKKIMKSSEYVLDRNSRLEHFYLLVRFSLNLGFHIFIKFNSETNTNRETRKY